MSTVDEEVEVEAVKVLRKKMKMRTVHAQIFEGTVDVYECPKPYVLILNISTEHEHSVRMDVHKQDLSREMRLWLEGKQIHNPLVVAPQRINDVMTRFVKFGKAPLQEDLIMWIASRAELAWAPQAECVFGGFYVPSPEEIAREAAKVAEKVSKEKDERDFGSTAFDTTFQQSAARAQSSQGYTDDSLRLRGSGKVASNDELLDAAYGPTLGKLPVSTDPRNPLAYDAAGPGTHGYSAKQMADLRRSREQQGPANVHMLTRELLGKSHALGSLKTHKLKSREGSKISVVTPELSGEHFRLGCEIQKARNDVTAAMDQRRRMIEIAKTRQKQSADHYREIREKAKENSSGWVRSANDELLTLYKIKSDIEEDALRQKNKAQRAQQRVMWTMAPSGYANRKGKSQPGVLLGPGPLPPQALFAQADPTLESTMKNYYWDSHGRRHERPAGAEESDGSTAEIVHHALEALRKAGKTLGTHKLDLKAVFAEFDSSGDGYLTMEEMAKALISLGVRLNTESMLALFDHFDHNRSGSVHYGEFLWGFFNRRELARKWRRSASRLRPQEIRSKFHEADKTGDGRLNRREFSKFLSSFGIDATAHEVDVMMFRFDLDGDGDLDLNEFNAFMENEISVLENVDAIRDSNVSPILAQSRAVVKKAEDQAAHGGGGSGGAVSSSKHGAKSHKPAHATATCKCSQFALHGVCAHVNSALLSSRQSVGVGEGKEEEEEDGGVGAQFITDAIKRQAEAEIRLGGSVFAKKQ